MHPLIKIVNLFVIFIFLAAGNVYTLILCFLLLLGLWLALSVSPSAQAWRMLKRLKWLFLSLFIIYAWFTPGSSIIEGLSGMPTWEGLAQSAERIAMLILMVFMVDVLITHTKSKDLIGGLYLFFKPLSAVGVNVKRLVLRAWLTLESISNVPRPVKQNQQPIAHRIRVLSDVLYQRFVAACEVREQPEQIDIVLPRNTLWTDWLVPVMLSIVFLIINASTV